MPFSKANDFITGRLQVPTPMDNCVAACRFEQDLATADLAVNTIGVIGILPAGYVPVGLIVDADDLDSNGTPTLAWSVGFGNLYGFNAAGASAPGTAANTLLSTATIDGAAALATGVTAGQTGVMVQPLSKALSRVQVAEYDRYIVLVATAGAATAVAGKVGVTVLYRPG